jgi:hypothetical protein
MICVSGWHRESVPKWFGIRLSVYAVRSRCTIDPVMTVKKPFSIRQAVREEPNPGLEEAPDALCYFIAKYREGKFRGSPAQAAEVIENFLHQRGIQRQFYNPHDRALGTDYMP